MTTVKKKDYCYKKEAFNHFWYFKKQAIEVSLKDALEERHSFEPVTLPHDWLIYDTHNLYETSSGWYIKTFQICLKEDMTYSLDFEGVYMDCTVYVNNIYVGEWKYGYTSFEIDMTKALFEGENTIVVHVRHEAPNSRWYSGAGIYRKVWLITRYKNHIQPNGLYISTKKIRDKWHVEIEANVEIHGEGEIHHTLMYKDQIVGRMTGPVKLGKNHSYIEIDNPKLWSVETPRLYTLNTELLTEMSSEIHTTMIGFKDLVMDANEGLKLNGKSLKLQGVCEHHDLGCLGAAFNKQVLEKRMLKLKEMGVNAIRTAHNIPAPELMSLADELGFLVVSEGFDMWERAKNPYDYARFFDQWIDRDVESWIKRDRNHVSLIMWSIGNEIYDTHVNSHGQAITKRLVALVESHDPKANGVITIGSNFMPWENAQACADIITYAGYNYAETYYEPHHKTHPEWVIYGSETSSIVQSRGIYHFPLESGILVEDDRQCSSLGNSCTSWGAKSMEFCLSYDRDIPYSLGQFIWTGYDYIGEPTPYDTKNAYFGQLDTAGFPKDSFYVYQGAWTSYIKQPMIHIFPYWNFNENQLIDVRVATNAPIMVLYLNDVLIGEKHIDHQKDTDLIPTWQIPYEKGTLKAIAYDENQQIIAECIRSGFGSPIKIMAVPDKETVCANGEDIAFIQVSMLDENNHIVETANSYVKVHVEGAGVLIGLDNGDSTDYESYKGDCRRLFSGKLSVAIGSTLIPGDIKIVIEAKHMEPVELVIESKEILLNGEALRAVEEGWLVRSGQVFEAGVLNARSIDTRSVGTSPFDTIPIHRIELIKDNYQPLSPDNQDVMVQVKIHPNNASSQELTYKVVNNVGVESILAEVTPMKNGCRVIGVGDGEFRLRCSANNGKTHADVLSEIEFRTENLGIAYKDPYEFIGAGLYDKSNGDVGNGNEKGIATGKYDKTVIGFEYLDFGAYGSDEITVPIFAFESKPHIIEIWEGMPDLDESSLLDKVIYDKNTIWNVYQEETYKLSRKVKGITTIAFVLSGQIHMKGFQFRTMRKAYEKLSILECDAYYGDHVSKEPWGMADIGNNVSFTFNAMNFDQGVSGIEICGRSLNDSNTIRIQTKCDGQSHNQVVEFGYTDDFVVKQFELKAFDGECSLEFIFLPGSHFDFKWFRFN